MKQPKIEVITHYAKYDKKFLGDYHAMELKVDGNVALSLGDYYRDKSDLVISGFLDGFNYALTLVPFKRVLKVKYVNKADSDF